VNFCGKYVNADGEIFNGTEPADYNATDASSTTSPKPPISSPRASSQRI
jgi:hypothetical protein